MPEMTGAQAMYEMMVRLGVKYVFGNPGTTELPLMDMFAARDEIHYILALHEDSALGIAAGHVLTFVVRSLAARQRELDFHFPFSILSPTS